MPTPTLPLWYRLAREIWSGPARTAMQRRPRPKRLANTLKRSELVRERLRFILYDLTEADEVKRYTLAQSGTPVCLRHARDIWAFDELLVHREYALPDEAEAALRGIGRPLRVLDLGAHVGLFGAWAAANWDVAGIVSFEAHPDHAAVLAQQSRAHTDISWDVVPAAAWNADGELPLAVDPHHYGHIKPDGAEEPAFSVPACDVLPWLMDTDVVKMDIDGSEWIVLEDPRFATISARVVVVEAHRLLCPDPRDPSGEAARALERAGLRVVAVRHKPYCGVALLWAIRPTDGDPPRPRVAARAVPRAEAAPSVPGHAAQRPLGHPRVRS